MNLDPFSDQNMSYTHLTDSRPSIDFCLHLQSSNLSHFLIFTSQANFYILSFRPEGKLYTQFQPNMKKNIVA